MKNEELSASPIKKQGSAAGGKANYRIENSKSQRSENNSKLLTLNSICHNSSCEPAATELKSKNAHGLSQMQRSLFTDLFFDLSSDFDCALAGQRGFKTDSSLIMSAY